jgi:aminoglycoside 3-N-acetyltransferase I
LSMTYKIRRLTPDDPASSDDPASFDDLLTLFGEVFDDPASYHHRRPGRAWTERLLAGNHFIALAAYEGGATVGGLAAYVLDKFEQERREIYVYDLAVDAAHRRRGIATALIAELQTIAARIDASVIFIQADHGDDPAIALYSKLGEREDVLHFDIPVPSSAGVT